MGKIKGIIIFSLAMHFFSCSSSSGEKEKMEMVLSDSIATALVSSSAAVENNKDTTRKFIRTADLKFKVKSVIASTYAIEELVNRQGGFVTYTNLTSHIDYTNTTAISSDSSLETTHFTVTNSIILRVSNMKLDSTLKEISKNIEFLDYRIIKADDVALDILSNNMVQNRVGKNTERLNSAIDNRGKKLNETTTAEDLVFNRQEQADNAKIANLHLKDQINFSTVNLTIYQQQTIKRELVYNEKNIDEYEPGFGSKLAEAVKFGWHGLESFFLLLVRMWAFLAFVIVAYLFYRRLRSKIKK
jgi:hypothetical protein